LWFLSDESSKAVKMSPTETAQKHEGTFGSRVVSWATPALVEAWERSLRRRWQDIVPSHLAGQQAGHGHVEQESTLRDLRGNSRDSAGAIHPAPAAVCWDWRPINFRSLTPDGFPPAPAVATRPAPAAWQQRGHRELPALRRAWLSADGIKESGPAGRAFEKWVGRVLDLQKNK
jgi:hypothetical protein